MLSCKYCNKTFNRKSSYDRHLETITHARKRLRTDAADIVVKKPRTARPSQHEGFNIRTIYKGFVDVFKIYRASFKRVYNDIAVVATMLLAHIVYLINGAVTETNGVKVHLRCTVKFYKAVEPTTTIVGYFISRPAIYLHSTNTEHQYSASMASIQKQIDEFTRNGSGWVVERIEKVDVYVNKYNPIRGSTYCKLPKKLAKKRAIINVKNRDNKCFMWSILAALHPARMNSNRVSSYREFEDGSTNGLIFNDIEQPMALDDIPRFEQLNPRVGINVFCYGDKGLYPIQQTVHRDRKIVNLLLLCPEDGPAHYCWIKDLGKLMFGITKYDGRKFICDFCLCHFNNSKRLEQHQEFCTADKQRMVIPEDRVLMFKNVHRRLRAPYVLYSDFECFNQSTDNDARVHVPNSYGLLGVKRCCKGVPDFEDPVVFRGENPVRHFLDTLLKKGEQYIRSCSSPLKMTVQQQTMFNRLWQCHICGQTIDGGSKHRDHCHVCGEYRGPAHGKCNMTARTSKDVTVLFHNLKKYDGHLIMQEIGTILEERGLKLECTAKSMEDYLSFVIRLKTGDTTWRIRFVDSLAFLPASLETLVGNLDKDKFTALRKFTRFPDLLSRKGFYPYDKATSGEIFDFPGLFPIADFYNSLTKESMSLDNYKHASHVYNVHGFSNFGQYHDLYLLTDILLLADVFENFRDFVTLHYGLDPVHYITLPSLAWDALLKKTGVKLDLLEDPNMYQFFTAGIRGGISVISHRYAKANNPYLLDYDPNEPNSYIMYMDANNLYGWAMNQALPVGEFQWVGQLDAVPDDGYGYVLEVDLEYPADLHDRHNDYPLAAERIAVPSLSPYCQQLKKDLFLGDQECEKLIPNLMDKTHYIIHHRNLKQCLDLGLKLKKIHRGIRFREEPWMATYIQFNTEMRKQATSAFEKDLFKLLNNAVFGKSMENIFNYMDVKLTANQQQYEKWVANPLYRDSRCFKNNLHAVLMAREQAELNKPIYTGFSILELSKLLMYDFHYGYIVPKYSKDAKLLFTDTDSLCYHVHTADIYKDMKENSALFDTSDYPSHHALHSTKNKKVMGKMKDETNVLLVFLCLIKDGLSAKKKGEDDRKKPKKAQLKAADAQEQCTCSACERIRRSARPLEEPSQEDLLAAGSSGTNGGSTGADNLTSSQTSNPEPSTNCKHTGACNCVAEPQETQPVVVPGEEVDTGCDHQGFCWCDRSMDNEPGNIRTRRDSADTILYGQEDVEMGDYALPELHERLSTEQCNAVNYELLLNAEITKDALSELIRRVNDMHTQAIDLLRRTRGDPVNEPAIALVERALRVFGNHLNDFHGLIVERIGKANRIRDRGLSGMNAIGGVRNHFEIFMEMGVLVDSYRATGENMANLVRHNTELIQRIQNTHATFNRQTIHGRDHRRALGNINLELAGTLNFMGQLMTLHGMFTENIRDVLRRGPPEPSLVAPVPEQLQALERQAAESSRASEARRREIEQYRRPHRSEFEAAAREHRAEGQAIAAAREQRAERQAAAAALEQRQRAANALEQRQRAVARVNQGNRVRNDEINPWVLTPCTSDENRCPICWESIKEAVATCCVHIFCLACIVKWITLHGNCPICRQNLR